LNHSLQIKSYFEILNLILRLYSRQSYKLVHQQTKIEDILTGTYNNTEVSLESRDKLQTNYQCTTKFNLIYVKTDDQISPM